VDPEVGAALDGLRTLETMARSREVEASVAPDPVIALELDEDERLAPRVGALAEHRDARHEP
jgi:hypothetical protein